MPFTLSIRSFTRPATDVIGSVSMSSNSQQLDGNCYEPRLSPDGRYVLFSSVASNLVENDTNGREDVFLKDLVTGALSRISVAADGTQALGGGSDNAEFSPDGRHVLFRSSATNLVPSDSNGMTDIFIKDLQTGAISHIITEPDGENRPGSENASFSPDGRYIVFESASSNLVNSQDTNFAKDIFIKDLRAETITRVSETVDGTVGTDTSAYASVSTDGQFVVFESYARNLVADDTNGQYDIFLKDMTTKEVVRVSTNSSDEQATGGSSRKAQLSENGRYVVFESDATNLLPGGGNGRTQIYRKDLETKKVVCVSTDADGSLGTGGDSYDARMSADGRYVTFTSNATNLVANDGNNAADVFRKDLSNGEIIRLSASINGEGANDHSGQSFISADGRHVLFGSDASNLDASKTNDKQSVFLVNTAMLSYSSAIVEGRYVKATLDVGGASSASVAWGDGTVDRVTPVNGSATFKHVYAAMGQKDATVVLTQGAQTWIVPHKVDLTSTTMVRNTALADTLIGSTGKDALVGDAYANILKGGLSKDVLTGGKGKDVFVFDTKPNKKKNLDKIVDFNVKDDTVWLDDMYFKNKVFKKLGKGMEKKPGKLKKAFFTIGDKAKDKDDYLIYNKKKGILYFDVDGSGSKAMVEVATLKKGLKMTYADFFII